MEIKLNDVYRFRYNEELIKNKFEPYWCFDGQLVVKQSNNGELYLEDTYWCSGNNKIFTLNEALQKGTLEFICNLDDVEECFIWDLDYYADEDLFNLSYQHNYYKKYYKRKGAKKSVKKMKAILEEKIKHTEQMIEWKKNQLKNLKDELEKLNTENINIY